MGSGLLCFKSVLDHFHTADKNIPETGQFTTERFIGLTASHEWGGFTIMAEVKKQQIMSHMDASRQKNRACAGKPIV